MEKEKVSKLRILKHPFLLMMIPLLITAVGVPWYNNHQAEHAKAEELHSLVTRMRNEVIREDWDDFSKDAVTFSDDLDSGTYKSALGLTSIIDKNNLDIILVEARSQVFDFLNYCHVEHPNDPNISKECIRYSEPYLEDMLRELDDALTRRLR